MRDYEVVVLATADPRTGIAPEHLRSTFKHCVRANVTSAVLPEVWAESLETNGHDITLVFSDLSVRQAAPGHAPFTVSAGAPDWKAPLP